MGNNLMQDKDTFWTKWGAKILMGQEEKTVMQRFVSIHGGHALLHFAMPLVLLLGLRVSKKVN